MPLAFRRTFNPTRCCRARFQRGNETVGLNTMPMLRLFAGTEPTSCPAHWRLCPAWFVQLTDPQRGGSAVPDGVAWQGHQFGSCAGSTLSSALTLL